MPVRLEWGAKTDKPACAVWHPDEMVVKIRGQRMYMWWVLDREGSVLGMLVQMQRNKAAALKSLRKRLESREYVPKQIVTDDFTSYRAALKVLMRQNRHQSWQLQGHNRV